MPLHVCHNHSLWMCFDAIKSLSLSLYIFKHILGTEFRLNFEIVGTLAFLAIIPLVDKPV